MGQLVLYLLAQAVGTLGFAYSMGSLAMRKRTLGNVLAAAGMYMILVAALVEVAADRLGWRPSWLAADLALVTAGIGLLGASVLDHLEVEGVAARAVRMLRWAVPVASLGCAMFLLALSGSDGAVVDHEGLQAETFGDGRSHLTTAGWALGAPLALGVASLILVGAHDVLDKRQLRGVGVWAGGILLLLWPFDLRFNDVTLMPVALLMGIACIYLGLAPKQGDPAPQEGGGGVVEAPVEPGNVGSAGR